MKTFILRTLLSCKLFEKSSINFEMHDFRHQLSTELPQRRLTYGHIHTILLTNFVEKDTNLFNLPDVALLYLYEWK